MTKGQRMPPPPPPHDEALLPSSRDCMRTRGHGRTCDRCGTAPEIAHVPMRIKGVFCREHCPVCSQVAREAATETVQNVSGEQRR